MKRSRAVCSLELKKTTSQSQSLAHTQSKSKHRPIVCLLWIIEFLSFVFIPDDSTFNIQPNTHWHCIKCQTYCSIVARVFTQSKLAGWLSRRSRTLRIALYGFVWLRWVDANAEFRKKNFFRSFRVGQSSSHRRRVQPKMNAAAKQLFDRKSSSSAQTLSDVPTFTFVIIMGLPLIFTCSTHEDTHRRDSTVQRYRCVCVCERVIPHTRNPILLEHFF